MRGERKNWEAHHLPGNVAFFRSGEAESFMTVMFNNTEAETTEAAEADIVNLILAAPAVSGALINLVEVCEGQLTASALENEDIAAALGQAKAELPPQEAKEYHKTMSDGRVIECTEHRFAYSGRIPCTGPWRCIYCGKRAEPSKYVRDMSSSELALQLRQYFDSEFQDGRDPKVRLKRGYGMHRRLAYELVRRLSNEEGDK